MDKLGILLERMERGSLIPSLTLEQTEVENALDERRDAEFAATWMSVFRQVEAIKGNNQDAEPRVRRLRELAYLQAYEQWKSPDLAAYISDDFGLLADALATDFRDGWLNGVLDSYLGLRFPVGAVRERHGNLGDQLT